MTGWCWFSASYNLTVRDEYGRSVVNTDSSAANDFSLESRARLKTAIIESAVARPISLPKDVMPKKHILGLKFVLKVFSLGNNVMQRLRRLLWSSCQYSWQMNRASGAR